MNLQESIRRILREEKLYVTPQELIRNLPKDLKDILFKQWGAKQNPEWHPEGNTLKHILVVIKRAYHHYPDDPNMVMAALFHDLGKIDTYKINPKTGQPTAYGHEDKSTDYVEQFRDWIESFEGTDVDEIKYLVKNHMKVKPSTWNQMKDKKKEPIISHPAFDKLMGFTDKLDGGGFDIEKKKLQETIRRILREETNIPQPGESSGKPLSQEEMGNMGCETDYLTIYEILGGRVQRIPYYKEVLQDLLNNDYSWGVTKKVIEYAEYMKRNPESLKNLPPIIVVDNVIQDGAHRISAIFLLHKYMDKKNKMWGEIKLKVKFCNTK